MKRRYFIQFTGTTVVTLGFCQDKKWLDSQSLSPNLAQLSEAGSTEKIQYPPDARVYNVKENGAFGDGIRDDTAALIKALNQEHTQVYFPNGTYLVSDTLVQANLARVGPIWQGESRDGVILKLRENAPGFNRPDAPRPLLRTAPLRVGSADFFRRVIANMTIDAGNNPGAIGLQFYSNNSGLLKDVKIIGQGILGLDLDLNLNGPHLVSNLEIEGFSVGLRGAHLNSSTLENITLKNQTTYGMELRGSIFVRGVTSQNTVPAVLIEGGLIPLIDAHFNGGDGSNPAIINHGALFARHINTEGYGKIIHNPKEPDRDVIGNQLEEWTSREPVAVFPSPRRSLNLPIEETPVVPWETDSSNWVNVRDFGAVGDSQTDDTAAIQAAIDAAAKNNQTVVYFPANPLGVRTAFRYSDHLYVHGSVTQLIGCAAVLMNRENKHIIIKDGTAPVVKLQRLYNNPGGSKAIIENASSRTVVLESCVVDVIASGPGKTFLEDIVGWLRITHPNHQVWGRHLNVESDEVVNIENGGGQLWLLGLKTERRNIKLRTTNGGKSELLGAWVYQTVKASPTDPMFNLVDSRASFAAVGSLSYVNANYTTLVSETQQGETRAFSRADNGDNSSMLLYVSGS